MASGKGRAAKAVSLDPENLKGNPKEESPKGGPRKEAPKEAAKAKVTGTKVRECSVP